MINIPKGTKDVLPQDSYKWHYIENNAREVAKLFNVKEIRTPVFEHTEVFLRGVGDTTDIVNKEMYTFLDKGNRSITLKPEGTAGVARSFIENGLGNNPQPTKMYYITPVFRYERPQAGRLREHHQFGVEFYGSSEASLDAELIVLAKTLLNRLGIKDLVLNINSIGCKDCRGKFNQALKDYYRPHLEEMCPTCRERFDKNPLRILDCKEENCININKNAPVILDYICDSCKEHFEKLQELLKVQGVDFEINPTIVRGLDYYSKTVFEFVSNTIGAKGTVCGGGRYDGLVTLLQGKETPAVGFGMGIERVMLQMEASGLEIPNEDNVDLYLISTDKDSYIETAKLCNECRLNGIVTDIDHLNRSVKANFKYAGKLNPKYVVVIGETERQENKVKVKNMANSTEEEVELKNLIKYILENKEK